MHTSGKVKYNTICGHYNGGRTKKNPKLVEAETRRKYIQETLVQYEQEKQKKKFDMFVWLLYVSNII